MDFKTRILLDVDSFVMKGTWCLPVRLWSQVLFFFQPGHYLPGH